MILFFNDYIPHDVFPHIFKNIFPDLQNFNKVFSVCTAWRAQKEIAWKAVLEDREYPQLRKYQILYEVSLISNFNILTQENLQRKEKYQKHPIVNHCRNTQFIGKYYPPIFRITDLISLIDQHEYDRAFALSRNFELQAELQNHIVSQVGYSRCLDLIFLFNKKKFLINSCITYLENGSKKLNFLVKINNKELPDQDDLEKLFEDPFFLSLKSLKDKSLNIEELHESVWNTYIKLFIFPMLNYIAPPMGCFNLFLDELSFIKKAFSVLPDDFHFLQINNRRIWKFFNRIKALQETIKFDSPAELKENHLNMIEVAKDLLVHPTLCKQYMQTELNFFYENYDEKSIDSSFDLWWPSIYKIEHAFSCQNFSHDPHVPIFDRSVETFIKYLLSHRKNFYKVFESNFLFATAFVKILEECPALLDYCIDETDGLDSVDKEYVYSTFSSVLALLKKHLKSHYVINAFIKSAPGYMQSLLLKESSGY